MKTKIDWLDWHRLFQEAAALGKSEPHPVIEAPNSTPAPIPAPPAPDSADEHRRAAAAWYARRAAALAAVVLPDAPLRIVHLAENDVWVVERAVAAAREWVKVDDERSWGWAPEESASSPWLTHRMANSVAQIDADVDIPAEVSWERLGPFAAHGGRQPFALFEEAEAWLQAYVRPVEEEYYFKTAGEFLCSMPKPGP